MLNLEDIALYGLYNLNGKTVQINEEHFLNLPNYLPHLTPILIDWIKLTKLGFDHTPPMICSKSFYDIKIYLEPTILDRWSVYLEGGNKIGIVQHIHQVQQFWYTMFGDHLFLLKSLKKVGEERVIKFSPGNLQIKVPSIKDFVIKKRYNSNPETFEVYTYKFNEYRFKETGTLEEINRMLSRIYKNWEDVHIIEE